MTSVSSETGSPDTYSYDANGNMTCRIENGVVYTHTYNAENRASSIAKRNTDCTGTIIESWSFAYDGDGVRVSTAHFTGTSGTPDSTTSYFMGGQFEVKDGATKKYYSIAGMMVAAQDASGLQYLLTDHLGSTVAVTNEYGTLTSQQRYLPFGTPRTIPNSPILGTDFTYTGQRKLDDGMGGIMDYKARFYSPYINRFLQPDSMIPNPANPQDYNRFSYVRNNPARYTDPSGHIACIDGEYCGKPPKPTTQYWERLIKKKFGVTLSGDWSMKNTSIMYFAMTNYDEAIGGNLSKFTSGLTFSFSYDAYHYGGLTSHNGNIAFHGNTLPYQNIYHELSHSIDYVSGGFFTTHLDRITVQTNNGDYVMGGPNYQRNGFGYNQTRVSDPNFLNGIEAEQHSNRTHCDRVGWCENGNTANEEWADLVANYVSGNFSDTGPFADYGITRKNWVQSIFTVYFSIPQP